MVNFRGQGLKMDIAPQYLKSGMPDGSMEIPTAKKDSIWQKQSNIKEQQAHPNHYSAVPPKSNDLVDVIQGPYSQDKREKLNSLNGDNLTHSHQPL